MIESMVHAICENVAADIAGRTAEARGTWNAICLADFGDTGAAFVALPQIPPRNVTWAREGKWVHVAKIAFEKYFLRKVQTGSITPIYEKYVLKDAGNRGPEAMTSRPNDPALVSRSPCWVRPPAAARAETLTMRGHWPCSTINALAAARNQAEAAGFEAQAARAQRWPTVAVAGSYTQLDDSPAFDFSSPACRSRPRNCSRTTTPDGHGDDHHPAVHEWTHLVEHRRGRGTRARRRRPGLGGDGRRQAGGRGCLRRVLRARKAHGVASSNVQTLEALARDTTSMFERELVPKNELLAVQVALADARQNELRAANAAEVALPPTTVGWVHRWTGRWN